MEETINKVSAENVDHTEVPTTEPTPETPDVGGEDLGAADPFADMTFGVPTSERYAARGPKEEKYPDTAVITMHPKPEEAKKAYRFELNRKAKEILGLRGKDAEDTEHIAFSFKVPNYMLLVNVTGKTEGNKGVIRFTKSGVFSDKASHNYLTKTLDIDETKEWEFKLTKVDHPTWTMANLELMNVDTSETTDSNGLNVPEESTDY